MEKWNSCQSCDSIINQLSAFLGVEGGRKTVGKKTQLMVVVAEEKPRQKPCRMTREHNLSLRTENLPVEPSVQKLEEYL